MVTRVFIAACTLLLLATVPSMGQAQDGGGGGAGGGPGPDGNGPPDFNQMRQHFEQQLKQQLGATDAEWTALQPKIEAVQNQMRDLRPPRPPFGPGGSGGPGGPGGPGDGQGPPGGPPDRQGGPGGGPAGPGPDNDSSSPVHQAMRNLVDAVNSPDSKPEDVKAALQAVRVARSKARAELAKARDELQQLVTPKQEALLVTMGILE